MSKPLTTVRLSLNNLGSKPFRTLCVSGLAAVMAFALFGGAVLSASLKNGFNSLRSRLGADIVVVPKEYESDYESIILTGEPSRFYFDKSVADQVAAVEGVSKTTTQFFITTLSAGCCALPVQVIGFDPETDFVVQPWIAQVYGREIGTGQLVAGSDIVVGQTRTLKFFNDIYKVAAQLDKSSTGMDSTVYATMDTIKLLVSGATEVGMQLSVDVYNADIDNSISAVLVKVADGYSINDVAAAIRAAAPGLGVIKSKSIFSGTSNNLEILLGVINAITAVSWISAALVLVLVFSVTTNGRKKEFAVLRLLGATRKKLAGIILAESFAASAAGSVGGTVLVSLAVFPFNTYIGDRMKLPYMQPDLAAIIILLLSSLLISLTVGTLAAVYSAVKISKAETYVTLREGE